MVKFIEDFKKKNPALFEIILLAVSLIIGGLVGFTINNSFNSSILSDLNNQNSTLIHDNTFLLSEVNDLNVKINELNVQNTQIQNQLNYCQNNQINAGVSCISNGGIGCVGTDASPIIGIAN